MASSGLYSLVWVVCVVIKNTRSDDNLCMPNFSCVSLSNCGPDLTGKIIYPCHKGLNLVCCPSGSVTNPDKLHLGSRKTNYFPMDCGVVQTDNKITGGETAELGQFPWMALLGYRQKSVPFTEFLCGGTLITKNYVLTAAHCINVDSKRELVIVRLGEHNLKNETDCVEEGDNKYCADPHIDIPVVQHVQHPQFNTVTLKNDIALVKLQRTVKFTDYIRPICLPFGRNLEKRDLTGQKFTISGWGKTSAKNFGGSISLQYARVFIWDQKTCNNAVPPEVKPLADTQICANGKKEDACKGDSGGPMTNATLDLDGHLRFFQIGIVSFASTLTCGVEELPPIYTRVDKYLTWIVDSIS